MNTFVFALAIVFNAFANILMKVGALKPKESTQAMDVVLNMALNPVIICWILCFALGLAAYNYVLIKTDLSVAYPIMTSMGYFIVVLFSWLFLKETISIVQLIGLTLIIAGVWMVAR